MEENYLASKTELMNKTHLYSIKQLCLRGTTLKNTEFILGIAVYTGHHTKLMKNAKHPRSKMSKILRKMNQILISVICFF